MEKQPRRAAAEREGNKLLVKMIVVTQKYQEYRER